VLSRSRPAYTLQPGRGNSICLQNRYSLKSACFALRRREQSMKFVSALVRRYAGTLLVFALLPFMLAVTASAQSNQDSDQESGETTVTGLVTSSSPGTLVVRGENGRYQLFVFDRSSIRPQTPIARGSRVTVRSVGGDEAGVRIARNISVVSAAAAASPNTQAGRTGASPGLRMESSPVPTKWLRLRSVISNEASSGNSANSR
jgi:hypothetical protein